VNKILTLCSIFADFIKRLMVQPEAVMRSLAIDDPSTFRLTYQQRRALRIKAR
jgi:hypothetical protein